MPGRDVSRRSFETPRKRVLMAFAYYEHRMHRGVADYAQKANWILDSTMAHYGTPPKSWRGEGVLTLVLPDRPDLINSLRELDMPIVALTRDVEDIATARVVLDNFQIGKIAGEHLIERGFKHLAFYKCTHYCDVQDREAGFASAVSDAGLEYTLLNWYEAERQDPQANVIDTDSSADIKGRTTVHDGVGIKNIDADSPLQGSADNNGRTTVHDGVGIKNLVWLKHQLLALPKPLGVFAQSDHRAYFLLSACEQAEIRVPEELAVVGVDNDEYTCEFAPVPITSVDSNREKLAYEGASLLDALIKGKSPPAEPILIPPVGLVVRHSSDILALDHPEVANALGFIWKHFHQRIGVNDVVAATAMSRCSLYKAFEQFVGRTMREEIERKRIELASRLLTTSTHKIAHIARLSGFGSGEQFCRAFVRLQGMTPSAFRESNFTDAIGEDTN